MTCLALPWAKVQHRNAMHDRNALNWKRKYKQSCVANVFAGIISRCSAVHVMYNWSRKADNQNVMNKSCTCSSIKLHSYCSNRILICRASVERQNEQHADRTFRPPGSERILCRCVVKNSDTTQRSTICDDGENPWMRLFGWILHGFR